MRREPPRRPPTLWPLRFALRELRAGVRGFYLFVAVIALGVAAIAGIGSAAGSLVDGLRAQGRVVLGGDLTFALANREASASELGFLRAQGRLSVAATLRAMARSADAQPALIELKAVDGQYPLYGAVAIEPQSQLAQLLERRDGVYGAAVDPVLLARLGIGLGARLKIAEVEVVVRAILRSEPDTLAAGIGFGPRVLTSVAALRESGLVIPGSLIRWHYRLALAGGARAAKQVGDAARQRFPTAGWELRTAENASPELARNIKRVSQFLNLVGLTALLVGGVGVANAVKSYVDRKREAIAILKTLGASGGRVFAAYLSHVLLLAAAGSCLGLAGGAALPFVIVLVFGTLIPVPMAPSLHLGALGLGLLYGMLTALCFAFWPLGRAHDLSVAALFRDEVAPERQLPRWRYIFGAAAALAGLAALAIAPAYDRRIAVVFVAAAAGVFVVLRGLAWLLGRAARAAPALGSPLLRLMLADVHRPGALTATIVLSLGLGITLLVSLTQIDGNLRREFGAGLPQRAPALYFLDIQHADAERFASLVQAQAKGARLERVALLRGRIVRVRGLRPEQLEVPANLNWVLQGDRGLTETATVPAGSRIVRGKWWDRDYHGAPLVSVDDKIAEGLGLAPGDSIAVNVLGREITATVANLRQVDWESLGLNFVLVFSPGSFAGAPHAEIATLTYPQDSTPAAEAAMIKTLAAAFPAVTIIRVKDVLEAIGNLVGKLMLAVRGASAITLVAAILVLAGALATGHRHRVYDAVVLRMLGASRRWLLALYGAEYLLLGLATAMFGVTTGAAAAAMVVRRVMEVPFSFMPGAALWVALGCVGITVVLGLLGTWAALRQKPATVLRHL